MIAAQVEEKQVNWRKVGDTGIIVVRPLGQGKAELVEAQFKAPDRSAPEQISWNKKEARWELRGGPEERGTIQTREGDVVFVFSDGLFKGGEFSGKSKEEIVEILVTMIGRTAVMAKTRATLPEVIVENVLDLGGAIGEPLGDDVVVGVAIV